MTREEWLTKATEILSTALFEETGHTVPPVRVSIGWPHGGRPSTIGQCWPGSNAHDGVGHIFISPVLHDPIEILAVLVHELVHAINHANGENGHGKPFSSIAKPIGLEGKMTATIAGEALTKKLRLIADTLGELKHSALKSAVREGGSKRSGRYIKVGCAHDLDAYQVRMSATAIAKFGTPICPCHNFTMIES